jgi:hypothetical protein
MIQWGPMNRVTAQAGVNHPGKATGGPFSQVGPTAAAARSSAKAPHNAETPSAARKLTKHANQRVVHVPNPLSVKKVLRTAPTTAPRVLEP